MPEPLWRGGGLALLLAGALPALAAPPGAVLPAPAPASGPEPCPHALASRPLTEAERSDPELARPEQVPDQGGAADYRDRIAQTPWGAARLPHWCVWLEPGSGADGTAANPWEQRWREAVEAALASWQAHVPMTRVDDPQRAQLLIRRRRPPRRPDASGRLRASHGRAELTALAVQRRGSWWLEPQVVLLISPDQRQQGIQATALHELGHGFGLWGHSDQLQDAMAAVPGAQPVLTPSTRDLATLAWLQGQPSAFGLPLQAAHCAGPPGAVPPDGVPPGGRARSAPLPDRQPRQRSRQHQGQQKGQQLSDHHTGAGGQIE